MDSIRFYCAIEDSTEHGVKAGDIWIAEGAYMELASTATQSARDIGIERNWLGIGRTFMDGNKIEKYQFLISMNPSNPKLPAYKFFKKRSNHFFNRHHKQYKTTAKEAANELLNKHKQES